MLRPDLLILLKLFELHSIKKCLVHTVRDTTAERSSVVILLNFPYRDGVHWRREGAIESARQGAQWGSIPCEGRQLHWPVVARLSGTNGLIYQHIHHPGEIGRRLHSTFLFVLRHKTSSWRINSCPDFLI